jgi:hypothetical protein
VLVATTGDIDAKQPSAVKRRLSEILFVADRLVQVGRRLFHAVPMFRYIATFCLTAITAPGTTSAASQESATPCGYRQAAVSLPVIQVSSAEVGHPWRAMYGYCLLGGERLILHQDWVLSYLDAKPIGSVPGGTGIGIGTDLLIRWHPDWRPSLLPYIDVGGGIQFAAGNSFPADGSRWMFTVHGGVGWLIPVRREREASVTLRYLHISNAGLADNNSGYDVVHLVLGLRWGR